MTAIQLVFGSPESRANRPFFNTANLKSSLFLLLFIGLSSFLNGQVITWNGNASTSWTNGANWDGGVVPGVADSANIPPMMPQYPLLNSTTTLLAVEVEEDASLTIGANGVMNLSGSADYGLNNSGTVVNNGRINIDNTPGDAINNLGSFTNNGDIIIGGVKPTVGGINNGGTFVNADCVGFINMISNVAILTYGAGVTDNGGGIFENFSGDSNISSNTGTVLNLLGGIFDVGTGFPPITLTGMIWTGCLSNSWGVAQNWLPVKVPLITDHVVIQSAAVIPFSPNVLSGTAAVARSVSVMPDASLEISSGGSLTVTGGQAHAIQNSGTIENQGTVTVTNTNGNGLNQTAASFTNGGTLSMGTVSLVLNHGINNEAGSTFLNESDGIINLSKSNGWPVYNSADFTNQGALFLNGQVPPTTGSVFNTGTFLNDVCAVLTATEFFNNSGSFTNNGHLRVNTPQIHVNTGTFTNDGLLEQVLNSPVPGLVNNNLLVAPVGLPSCGQTGSSILQMGGSVSFTAAENWYSDPAQTILVGTWNQGANEFTAPDLPVGPHTVYFSGSDDANGCPRTISIVVTVAPDMMPPTAVCQDVELPLIGSSATLTTAQVDDGSSDLCGILSLSLNKTRFTCANTGPNTVILTVTDLSGNTSTCAATINVTDVTTPTAICKNISVPLVGTSATITAVQLNNGSLDNCLLSFSASQTSFDCSNAGPNSVVLTVSDPTGNSSTCTSTVTILDNANPNAICQPLIVPLVGSSATITAAELDGGSSDNCTFTLSASKTTFTCANIGVNSVVLTVTDVSGGTSQCTTTVTIKDETAPTAICQNINLQLTTATGTITAAQVNNGSIENCTISSLVLSKTSFNCSNLGPNAVVLTVKDQSNNSSSCAATVTVLAPVSNINIADKLIGEGSPSGNTAMIFTVTRSNGSCPASVNWATSDGTATLADNDYFAGTALLSFTAAQTSKTFTVNVKKDNKVELSETFNVNLSAATNGTIADGAAVGTIQNDDNVVIQMANIAATEGNAGLKTMNFSATLVNPVDVPVTFNYSTSNGTATLADNDYVACTGCVATVPAGALSALFAVQAVGDTKVEVNETFNVAMSGLNAQGRAVTLAYSTRTATITNDDSTPLLGNTGGWMGSAAAENWSIEAEISPVLIENAPASVFPNPTGGELFVPLNGPGEFLLEQRDVFGKLLFSQKVVAADGPARLDLSHFANGLYFLSIKNVAKPAENRVIRWAKSE